MKHTYKITNLDCPNCANKIECKLNEQSYIDKATLNFSTQTLVVYSNKNNLKKELIKIIKGIEPNSNLLEKNDSIKDKKIIYNIIKLVLGIVLSLLGMYVFKGTLSKITIILSYLILLSNVIKKAINLLIHNHTINENLLITISCIGAYLTDNIHEGIMVVVLYEIGKILESVAVNNSRKSISSLLDIKSDYANLKIKEGIKQVDPSNVKINDIIIVKVGEKVPLDGVVISGNSKLNTSALTGESKPIYVNINDEVLSGSINMSGLLEIKVTKEYKNSTVNKILELTEVANERKAKTETFVASAAKIYTPVILILAILLVLVLPLFDISRSESIYRALVFLVVSCPCAIAISVPLSYFSGIGVSSKHGILIKGSDYLDAMSNIKEIIFDKTGTLTTGSFTDYKLTILDKNYKEKDIIEYYVSGESLSNHPYAKSILNLFNNAKIKKVTNFKEISGKGITFNINNQNIKIGSSSFCSIKEKNSYIYLNIDNKNVAYIELLDGIKKNSKEVINTLNNMNINTCMYTGDNEEIANNIAKKLNIKEVEYNLLPQDKFKLLEEKINESSGVVAFVGDGINDSPSLALANIGISMGSIGSDSAIEASDIVIMNDNLNKIIEGINISKYTKKIIKANLIFAISIKIIVLLLSALGLSSMLLAVFADTGVTLLTILNTTRILKK